MACGVSLFLEEIKDDLIDFVRSLPQRDMATSLDHVKLRACDGPMEALPYIGREDKVLFPPDE